MDSTGARVEEAPAVGESLETKIDEPVFVSQDSKNSTEEPDTGVLENPKSIMTRPPVVALGAEEDQESSESEEKQKK